MKYRLIMTLLMTCLGFGTAVQAAESELRSLENLERERAQWVSLMLQPQLSAAERLQHSERLRQRLVDYERMVLRDDRLVGVTHPLVRQAFANYDATFVVHAAAEAQQHWLDYWLQQQGLTTDRVLTTQPGAR